MLIYNNRKEFVNVTDDTLSDLGYYNARQLHEDAVDFADLFENKPGFVHNFKNFSWIDFLLHSEQDNIKARIRCNGKIYECGFKISNYPMDNDDDGFAIDLTELVTVGEDENSHERSEFDDPMDIESDEIEQNIPLSTPVEPQIQYSEPEVPVVEPVAMPEFHDEPITMPEITSEPISLPDFDDEPLSIEPLHETVETETHEATLDFDLDMGSDLLTPDPEPIAVSNEPVAQTTASSGGVDAALVERLGLETPTDYTYDPSIAADELGLPADLIDEFVGDFIIQAKKFRPDLEEAINKQDYDNIQILSHKLKGVAANLRIEDALEVLTFINTSKDDAKLNDHLKYLYFIVDRLELGDAAPAIGAVTETAPLSNEPATELENFDLDTPMVDDTAFEVDTPSEEHASIDMPDFSMDFDTPSEMQIDEDQSSGMDNLDLDIVAMDDTALEISSDTSEDTTLDDTDMIAMDFEPMDLQPIESDEAAIAPAGSQDDAFSFDLIDESDHATQSIDMDFDEPIIAMDDEPFEAPQIDLPIEEERVANTPLGHIDTEKFDIHATAESLDIPMDTLKSYVDDFVDQANELKGELETALTSQNLDHVKELATQLKGMSEALNMNHATELLSTLQTTSDPKEAIESAKELFIFIREL